MKGLLRKIAVVAVVCIATTMLSAKTSRVDSLSLQMQTLEQQVTDEQHEIKLLQKELSASEKEMNAVCEHVDRANEAVANQIAASSHTIQAWGIVFSVLSVLLTGCGIVFGYYINRMWEKTSAATKNVKEQLLQVKEISEDIQNNMSAIYKRLKREETIALLSRLEEIPEDIVNISKILLSRVLQEEDFPKLLNAYHNLISRGLELTGLSSVSELRRHSNDFRSQEASYSLQFAQHFMGKSIADAELRKILQPRFGALLKGCFFRNDAEKSTIDFKKGVSTLDVQLQTELIKDYVLAMTQSPYAKFTEWYKVLFADLSEKQLEEIWSGVTRNNANANFFAQAIKDVVESLNPQSSMIDKINAYLKKQ